MGAYKRRARSNNDETRIDEDGLIHDENRRRARKAAAICGVVFLFVWALCMLFGNTVSISRHPLSSWQKGISENSTGLFDTQNDAAGPPDGEGDTDGFYVSKLWESIYSSAQCAGEDDKAIDSISTLKSWGFKVSEDEKDVADVPGWAKTEIPDLQSFSEWVANDDFTLIGLFEDGDKKEVFDAFAARCRELGWVFNDNVDGFDSISMVKQKGECRWMMATFVQGEETASIVLHIQHV